MTGTTILPAAWSRSSAAYASAVSLPSLVSVSSISVNTPRIARRTRSGIAVSGIHVAEPSLEDIFLTAVAA